MSQTVSTMGGFQFFAVSPFHSYPSCLKYQDMNVPKAVRDERVFKKMKKEARSGAPWCRNLLDM